MNMKASKFIVRGTSYLILSVGSITVLFPLFWMLSTALMTNVEVQTHGIWWPARPNFQNFYDALTILPFGRWTLNTFIITISTIIGTLISSTLVAYGFARFKGPGKNVLFMIMLGTMMLPDAVTMIPLFVIFRNFGWINTFYPLIVPFFFSNAFAVFLLRQFFMTLPVELEEAAKLDGLSTLGILWRIIMPLTKPALTAVAIFRFNDAWNDFMRPLIYLNTQDRFTLALGINFFRGVNEVQWNYLMAASLVSMIPSLIIFFIGQKYFIEGISISSGMKG